MVIFETFFFGGGEGVTDVVFDIIVGEIRQSARFLPSIHIDKRNAEGTRMVPYHINSPIYGEEETWSMDAAEHKKDTHYSDANENTD